MRVLLAVLLLLSPAWGQKAKPAPKKPAAAKKTAPKPAAGEKFPLAAVTIEGNKVYPAAKILPVTGLTIGQPAGKPEFDAARDRLLATGLFDNVGYQFAPAPGSPAYVLTLQVSEVEPFLPVRFERLDAPEADLRRILQEKDPLFGERIPATEPVLKRHAAALEAYLTAKGKPGKVIAKVMADAPDKFSIVFRPAAPEPAVAEVKFTGNEVIPAAKLLDAFAGTAYGVAYREPVFRQMLEASVRPVYEARGRIQVTFPKLAVEKSTKVEGLVVTVTVVEGPSFDLGAVEFAGESPVAPQELQAVGGFQSGDLANFELVNQGLDRVRTRLKKDGYLRAELEVKRRINQTKKSVDLTVVIAPGPQYLFRKLTLEGLDLHGESAIKKLWILKEGKPFNGTYPDFFLQQIRERGLFDDLGPTKSKVDIDEDAKMVDVTLIFRPAPTEPGAIDPATGRRRRR